MSTQEDSKVSVIHPQTFQMFLTRVSDRRVDLVEF